MLTHVEAGQVRAGREHDVVGDERNVEIPRGLCLERDFTRLHLHFRHFSCSKRAEPQLALCSKSCGTCPHLTSSEDPKLGLVGFSACLVLCSAHRRVVTMHEQLTYKPWNVHVTAFSLWTLAHLHLLTLSSTLVLLLQSSHHRSRWHCRVLSTALCCHVVPACFHSLDPDPCSSACHGHRPRALSRQHSRYTRGL